MNISSISPATGKLYKEFESETDNAIRQKLNLAENSFKNWKNSKLSDRSALLQKVALLLEKDKDVYAKSIVMEVGKRISEARAEIEKCALVCRYYAENSEKFLTDEQIETNARKSFIRFEPLGIVLSIMPWNFPFWQVFRAAAPAIMAGNVMVLKHASNVPEAALLIEKIFTNAGAPEGLFQTLLISSKQVEIVISDPRVRMVSLTGSEEAGVSVASQAGRHLKKVVLELGGSDPFIVLDDADIDKASETAVTARMIVSGQSCIAAKRFIVHQKIAKEFIQKFKHNLSLLEVGDPLDPKTGVGPMSSAKAVESIVDQVKRSVDMGAKLIIGGEKVDRPGFFFLPTIVSEVTDEMPVMSEETFGPVAAIQIVSSDQEALEIANHSRFGLAASVWTENDDRASFFVSQLEAGGVFINSMVKSDPRMPFGGSKFSGFGRELSAYGLKEFTNIKSVWFE